MDTDVIETIDDSEDDLETVEEPIDVAAEPQDGPFFRNWVWWCSLIAAVPGLALVISIVSGMASFGPDFTGMMWVTSIGAAIGAGSTVVLPLLIGQGKFLGGEIVEAPVSQMVEASTSAASSSMLSMPDSGVDYGPEDSSDEMDELFDSTDAAVALDQDSEDDLDDFDDF